MAEIKYEVVRHIGVLSEGSKGWQKELNLISWNDREPKFDIRDWVYAGGADATKQATQPEGEASEKAPQREKMGKGVTLSNDEISKLKQLLEDIGI